MDTTYVVAGGSNSTDGDVTGNHGGYDFWIVKLAFLPILSAPHADALPALLCGTSAADSLWVRNVGSKTLVIDSATFDAVGEYALVDPANLPDSIQPGDSLRFVVRFTPVAAGTRSTTLNIFSNDTSGHAWPINFTGHKDSVGFAVLGVARDTIDFGVLPCNTAKDTTFLLASISSIATTFGVSAPTSFTLDAGPRVTLDSGASRRIVVHFGGMNVSGSLLSQVVISDTCGHAETIMLKAIVEDPVFAFSVAPDTTVCAGDSATRDVIVRNLSRAAETLELSGSNTGLVTMAPTTITLSAGDSSTIVVTFHGTNNEGTYTTDATYLDACGNPHEFSINIKVINPPPVQLTLAANAATTSIGDERTVYLIAAPPPLTDFLCTIANEPTALYFDSAAAKCPSVVQSAPNTITVQYARCALDRTNPTDPTDTRDTVAVLYYRTLVGSTLAPWVRLSDAATTNTCQSIAGIDTTTLPLNAPGCELGTVIVQPFTTGIYAVYPNPVLNQSDQGDRSDLSYAVAEEGAVSIVLYDALARPVQTIVDVWSKPGAYVASMSTGALPSGIYWVQLRTEGRIFNRELCVVR